MATLLAVFALSSLSFAGKWKAGHVILISPAGRGVTARPERFISSFQSL